MQLATARPASRRRARFASSSDDRHFRQEPPRQCRLRQLLVDEVAGARAETGAGVCRRADVPEAVDRRLVAGRLREWPEEEVLVEPARAAVDVAADEVDVERLDVRRRHCDTSDRRALEVAYMAPEPRNDAVGVRLAQLLGPLAVSDVELARRVALDTACRQLL
jgi:hypothetical protein